MKVPNAENAIIDIRKLRDYCLDESHSVGKHKARLFASALNLDQENAEDLRDVLLIAVRQNEAEKGKKMNSVNDTRLILSWKKIINVQPSEAVG